MSLIQRTAVLMPLAAAALAAAMVLGGCRRDEPVDTALSAEPAAAVTRLIDDLRSDDLIGYARHALPPALHGRIALAWDEGRTLWPLTALPLDDRLPALLTALAAPDAEKTLQSSYNRQFAGADRELHTAAATLGLFATQYITTSGDYSPAERHHYRQVVGALTGWAGQAPLGDAARAKVAIPQLVAAARLTGLTAPGALREAGMERSLTRLAPFFARVRQVLATYGLDLDQSLAGARVSLVSQTDTTATVALDYTLAGQPIQAELRLEKQGGGWYLSDLLRHAEAAAARGLPGDGGGAAGDTEPDLAVTALEQGLH